jgi:hypothetical protein
MYSAASVITRAGLPDLSWFKIPKREKYTEYTEWPQNVPNGRKN